jgi:hypothetical protein
MFRGLLQVDAGCRLKLTQQATISSMLHTTVVLPCPQHPSSRARVKNRHRHRLCADNTCSANPAYTSSAATGPREGQYMQVKMTA